jgi:phosphoglycerate dehydrogenase-like enzyme
MTRPKIVLWRPMYDSSGQELLADAGAAVTVVDSPDATDVIAALPGALALWVRTPERVTREVLQSGDALVVVSTSGFGTDNIDLQAATERGILVVNHPGFGRVPVAEHTVMMLLAAAKRLTWGDAATRDASAWTQRSDLGIFELEGKTVGIVGLGFIGSEVARKLRQAFRCRVICYDPYADPRIAPLADVEMAQDLPTLLGQSGLLCLCAELTDETRDLIGAEELAMLPRGAIVVNTARGRILDLDALVDALDTGQLRAAGLDVAYPEPLPPGHPILSRPDVILSPHTAGMSEETAARLAQSAADQILAALGGAMPAYPVNPEAWAGAASRRPVPRSAE